MSRYVVGANLPDPNQKFYGIAVVSGWGTLSSNGPSPDTLQAVDVSLVTDKSNLLL